MCHNRTKGLNNAKLKKTLDSRLECSEELVFFDEKIPTGNDSDS
jgi:hypothetical protein